jgi:DNA-binding NtrC family response regulator
VHIPPLKNRKEDIDLLCDHFLRQYADRNGKAHRPLSDRLREQFYKYSWPGNVRELENVIQAIATLGNEESFYEKIGNYGLAGVSRHRKGRGTTAHTPIGSASNLLTRYTLKELAKKAARQAETDTILDVLSHTDWNRKRAAALLKTSYRTLLSKIKEYEIEQQGGPMEEAVDPGNWQAASAYPLSSDYLQCA